MGIVSDCRKILFVFDMESSGSGAGGISKKAFAEGSGRNELFTKIRKMNHKRIEIDLALLRTGGQWRQGKGPSVRLSCLLVQALFGLIQASGEAGGHDWTVA
mgnify:CR=1 FL=1